MTLKIGQLVDRHYRILHTLSQGGFGVIYLALDDTAAEDSVRRLVVIKESKTDDSAGRNSLLEEINLLSRIQHPHMPRIYDSFYSDEQRLCIVMEYILGNNLEYFYKCDQRPDVETTVTWIIQVLEVLAKMHTENPPIVHRDVKLANIQIHSVTRQAYLLDFGIAKSGLHTRLPAYTPPYAPPEQYRSGQTTPATDVYAVGVCLYMLLTGKEPPEGIDRENERLPLVPSQHNPSLPTTIDTVVAKATILQPSDRYPNAQAMLADLEPIRPDRQIAELKRKLSVAQAEAVRQHVQIAELQASYTTLSKKYYPQSHELQYIPDHLASGEVGWRKQIVVLEAVSAAANHTILTLIWRYPWLIEKWLLMVVLSLSLLLLQTSEGLRIFLIVLATSLYLPISLAVASLCVVRISGWYWHRNVLMLCVFSITYNMICSLIAISVAALAGYYLSSGHLIGIAVIELVIGLVCGLSIAGGSLILIDRTVE